jgi:hypothetical protein
LSEEIIIEFLFAYIKQLEARVASVEQLEARIAYFEKENTEFKAMLKYEHPKNNRKSTIHPAKYEMCPKKNFSLLKKGDKLELFYYYPLFKYLKI